MGRFTTRIGDAGLLLAYESVSLIKGVSQVRIQGNTLQAKVDNELEQEQYEDIAKQLVLVYGFCFKNVYSEQYQISTPSIGFHYSGHETYKAELLTRRYTPTAEFVQSAHQLCGAMLGASLSTQEQIVLFNYLSVWNKAYELQQLHLAVEAQLVLAQIIDSMQRDQPTFKSGKLVPGLGIVATDADVFAARILLAHGRDKVPSGKDELEGFSYLYRLRSRQVSPLDISAQRYNDAKIRAEIEQKNGLIFEITRLYIIWLAGLEQYQLNSQASRFKIQKSKTG